MAIDTRTDSTTKRAVAEGTSIAAAIILATVGVLGVLQGIAAIAKDDLFVVGVQYVYRLDLTTWGWIHLVIGAIVVLVGFGMLTGATWARIGGVVALAVSIIANFLWIPYYPWWSLTVIALAVVGIWGIVAWQPDRV